MRKSLLVFFILLLAVSCSDENPVNSGDGIGTAVIICTITPEHAAKPADLKPTTSAIITFYDSNDALLTQETLTVIGSRITGSVKVKAGSGFRVELLCYDTSNKITHSGTASNVSIVANKTTTITIILTPAIPEAPQADGPDSVMVSGTQYTITWTEVSRAKSYTIEEALNSGFTEPVQKTIVGTSESYTKNTDAAKTYYYRVRTNNSAGNSGWSNTVAVVIEPVPVKQFTLTMAVNQSDRGTTTPAVGTYSYDENSVVVITATPVAGYRFVNWTGDAADTGSSSTTVTMTGDKTVTANFEEIPPSETDIIFVSILGGTFQMGDEIGDLGEGCRPVHTVTVSSFEMSTTEITNAQYAAYLNEALATGDITATSSSVTGAAGEYKGLEYIYLSGIWVSYPENKCWIDFSNGTFSVSSGKENWPVVYVTWYGEKAFSLYYGLDLPTEAEWEYAARGGRQYLCGTVDGTLEKNTANYNNYVGHPVDVGSYPANPYGLYDLSGNVSERCNDWYGSEYYSESLEHNPTGVQSSFYRVERGGGWLSDASFCRSADRRSRSPGHHTYNLGFRVVRRPGEVTY